MNVHAGRVCKHTGYDVTDLFQLAVTYIKKRAKMPPQTVQLEFLKKIEARITKLYTVVGDNGPHKSVRYGIASCF